jgi:hypothetical protein
LVSRFSLSLACIDISQCYRLVLYLRLLSVPHQLTRERVLLGRFLAASACLSSLSLFLDLFLYLLVQYDDCTHCHPLRLKLIISASPLSAHERSCELVCTRIRAIKCLTITHEHRLFSRVQPIRGDSLLRSSSQTRSRSIMSSCGFGSVGVSAFWASRSTTAS